jgi:hypothetical protein
MEGWFNVAIVPPEFTRVPFPVKALKLLLHELQPSGEAPSLAVPSAPLDTQSDDGVSGPLVIELSSIALTYAGL